MNGRVLSTEDRLRSLETRVSTIQAELEAILEQVSQIEEDVSKVKAKMSKGSKYDKLLIPSIEKMKESGSPAFTIDVKSRAEAYGYGKRAMALGVGYAVRQKTDGSYLVIILPEGRE